MGGSMLLIMFADQSPGSFEPYWIAILAAGIGMSRWGYLRTDNMLSARSTGRNDSRPGNPPAKRSIFEFDSAATGFKHFSTTTIVQTICFTLVYVAIVSLIQIIVAGFYVGGRGSSWLDTVVTTVRTQGHILVFMPSFFLATRFMAARVFRMLPMTAHELGTQFIKLATITVSVQCSVIFAIIALFSDITSALEVLPRFVLTGCAGTLFLPLILRFAFKPITLVIAFAFFAGSGILHVMFRQTLPAMVGLPAGLVILVICRFLIGYILAHSSAAYRHTIQNPFGANLYGKG